MRLVSLAVATLALIAGCNGAGGRGLSTNVLVVTIDTLRADHCSVQGYARATTPGLEKLARQGARVELAYAAMATTLPSHSTLFTSLYPIAHGVRKNGMPLGADVRTLAEMLGEAGYQTAAIVSSFVLHHKFGLSQGFDSYDDQIHIGAHAAVEGDQERAAALQQRADVTTDKAIRWLREARRPERPFFLFVHYYDPHTPYVPPEPFASRFVAEGGSELEAAIAAYDGEIAFADQELQRLLDELELAGLAGDTLVVVTSDHGEGLMQHGHLDHGVHIYEEAVRVPLLLRLPGRIDPGRVLGGPVALVDVTPTILGLVGVRATEELQGQSFEKALLEGATLDPRRAIFLHRRHYEPGRVGEIPVAGEKFGVRVGPWKYIEGAQEGTRELFNLEQDPGERINLYEPSRPEVLELQARLADWRAAYERQNVARPALSDQDRERLRSLGYVQ